MKMYVEYKCVKRILFKFPNIFRQIEKSLTVLGSFDSFFLIWTNRSYEQITPEIIRGMFSINWSSIIGANQRNARFIVRHSTFARTLCTRSSRTVWRRRCERRSNRGQGDEQRRSVRQPRGSREQGDGKHRRRERREERRPPWYQSCLRRQFVICHCRGH